MIRVICSRYAEEASQGLFSLMKKSMEKGRRAYLVVPSQYTVEAEEALFSYFQTDVLLNMKVKSFSSLQREILQQAGGLKKTPLSEAGRRMLLRLILEDPQMDFEVFSKEVRKKGCLERLAKDLQEYKEYGMEAETLLDLGRKLDHAPHIQKKMEELSKIFSLYQKEVESRFSDSDDRLSQAFEKLSNVSIFEGIDFYFDSFYSMSKIELEALSSLYKKGLDVHIALCLPFEIAIKLITIEDRDIKMLLDESMGQGEVFELSSRFFKKLQEFAKDKLVVLDAKNDAKPKPVFQDLSSKLFSFRFEQGVDEKPPITLYRYRNTREEVEGVVIAIKKKIQEDQAHFHQFQVVITSDEEYGLFIKHIFSKEGLPFFMDEIRSLDYHPLLIYIKSLLQIIEKNYRKEDVLQLLKTGLTGVNRKDIEVYENFVERRKIQRGMFLQEKYFLLDENFAERYPRKREKWEEEYRIAHDVNQKLLTICQSFSLALDKAENIRDYCKELFLNLEETGIKQALHDKEEKLKEQGKQEEWEENKQIWDQFLEVLDQLVLIAGEEKSDFALFHHLLDEGLSSISVGIIPPFQDQIIVTSIHRSRTRTRDFVYFLGFSDLYFPSAEKKASLLTELEIDLIQEMGFFLPSMQAFRDQEEKLSFSIQLSKIGEEAHFSYSALSSSNEPMNRSLYLDKLVEVFPKVQEESISSFPLEDEVYSLSLLEKHLANYLRQGGKVQEEASKLLEMLKKSPHDELAYRIEDALHYDNKREDLSPLSVQALYPSSKPLSCSQLEAFSRCPYQYFIQYGLRPDEIRVFDLDARDFGNLIHGSLDLWTAKMAEDLELYKNKNIEEGRQDLLQAYMTSLLWTLDRERREDVKNEFYLSLVKKTLLENSSTVLKHLKKSDILQIDQELCFSKNGPLQPISFKIDDHEYFIEGQIDRLDQIPLPEPHLQLIDYKTGNKQFDLSRLLGGLDLQLLLYLKAGMSHTGLSPMGCFYFSIQARDRVNEEEGKKEKPVLDGLILKDEKILDKTDEALYRMQGRKRDFLEKDNALTKSQFNSIIDHSLEQAKINLCKRQKGQIAVHPYRLEKSNVFTPCNNCSYQTLCRFEKTNQFASYRKIENIGLKEWKENIHGGFYTDKGTK